MKVLVWPANDDASAWYRLKFPARVLAGDGLDVAVDTVGPLAQWDRRWVGTTPPHEAVVVGLERKPDADVVVINRPGRAHWAEMIPHLQAAGVRVVVDVDDDFAAIPVGNSARATYQQPRCNGKWLERACLLADLVTTSTPDLARRYAPHGRVVVLPNLVPAAYLDVEISETWERTIGWSGSVDTHPGDLETTGRGVADVLATHDGWSVHVVGTGKGVAQRLGIDQVNALGKWLPFEQYPHAMARLSIGIVPLQDSRFNRSKSALKMAEFGALGVPVVASPTPDNRRLHQLGVGMLAASPREWRAHLTRLIDDDGFRADCAHAGREAMKSQTYEQHADRWHDAWSAALTGRKAA